MELYIGAKFYGHDSAICMLFPEERDIVAVSTERFTRYKHDTLFPVLTIRKMLRYKKIRPEAVKVIHFANSFTTQAKEIYSEDLFEKTLRYRKFYKAHYLKDFLEKEQAFASLSMLRKVRAYITSVSGLSLLLHRFSPAKKLTLDEIIKKHLKKYSLMPQYTYVTTIMNIRMLFLHIYLPALPMPYWSQWMDMVMRKYTQASIR